ncbi:MAG: hypothetical protein O2821_11375 [Chloroflexi bacterium]|nr:hypothetical protein [Chloroflexota bacterium]MDA1228054.1 hypothetical protein [Chloroflexota bacterium]
MSRCPRCFGFRSRKNDSFGEYVVCLNCGYLEYLDPDDDLSAFIGEDDPADSSEPKGPSPDAEAGRTR